MCLSVPLRTFMSSKAERCELDCHKQIVDYRDHNNNFQTGKDKIGSIRN